MLAEPPVVIISQNTSLGCPPPGPCTVRSMSQLSEAGGGQKVTHTQLRLERGAYREVKQQGRLRRRLSTESGCGAGDAHRRRLQRHFW